MAVTPGQAQGIIADARDLAQLEVTAADKARDAVMSLTLGAGAITSQDFVFDALDLPVVPGNFKIRAPCGALIFVGCGLLAMIETRTARARAAVNARAELPTARAPPARARR